MSEHGEVDLPAWQITIPVSLAPSPFPHITMTDLKSSTKSKQSTLKLGCANLSAAGRTISASLPAWTTRRVKPASMRASRKAGSKAAATSGVKGAVAPTVTRQCRGRGGGGGVGRPYWAWVRVSARVLARSSRVGEVRIVAVLVVDVICRWSRTGLGMIWVCLGMGRYFV